MNNQAIELKKLISEQHVTPEQVAEVVQSAMAELITDIKDDIMSKQVYQQVATDEVKNYASIYPSGDSVLLYLRQAREETPAADIHDLRTALRNALGTWSDSIQSTYVSGETLQVTFKQKVTSRDDETPSPIEIAAYYPLDNLPEGLLKPSCKIVEKITRTIECEV